MVRVANGIVERICTAAAGACKACNKLGTLKCCPIRVSSEKGHQLLLDVT